MSRQREYDDAMAAEMFDMNGSTWLHHHLRAKDKRNKKKVKKWEKKGQQ